jgi:hypothetical protein
MAFCWQQLFNFQAQFFGRLAHNLASNMLANRGITLGRQTSAKILEQTSTRSQFHQHFMRAIAPISLRH